jgi:hypothetical protein
MQECVEQGMNNLGRLAANPNGRQSENTDQIIDASPELLYLL